MLSLSQEALPGADIVRQGAQDLESGQESPEHKLYGLLVSEMGDAAHSAYNALIRRLVSFEPAAACAS